MSSTADGTVPEVLPAELTESNKDNIAAILARMIERWRIYGTGQPFYHVRIKHKGNDIFLLHSVEISDSKGIPHGVFIGAYDTYEEMVAATKRGDRLEGLQK